MDSQCLCSDITDTSHGSETGIERAAAGAAEKRRHVCCPAHISSQEIFIYIFGNCLFDVALHFSLAVVH